jgi:hypothetical protein
LGSGKHIDLVYYFILGATVAREMAWLATVVTALRFRSIVLFLCFLWVTWLGVDVAQVYLFWSVGAVNARMLWLVCIALLSLIGLETSVWLLGLRLVFVAYPSDFAVGSFCES